MGLGTMQNLIGGKYGLVTNIGFSNRFMSTLRVRGINPCSDIADRNHRQSRFYLFGRRGIVYQILN